MMCTWRVELTDPETGRCGAGVLVAERQILSCAHLVPTRRAMVARFPGCSDDAGRPVAVASGGWFPAGTDERGDIAVLESAEALPVDARPARWGSGRAGVGQTGWTFGHPAGLPHGVWTPVRILPSSGPGAEWLQLGAVSATDRRIEPGFSGAGVLDTESDAVVGIVVAASTLDGDRLAWMIPTETIERYWPGVRASPAEPTGEAGEAGEAGVRRLVEALCGLRSMRSDRSRDQVIAALPGELAIRVPRDSAPLADVYGMVLTCLDFEDGLSRLLAAVRFFEGPTRRMRAVDRLVDELGLRVFG